jgi:hypothetical protein
MPAPLVQLGATVICPHGGQITDIPSNTRVLAGGTPLASAADTFLVAGCAFVNPAPAPSPCLRVQWLTTATRVTIGGSAAILQTSSGLCLNPASVPQGSPVIAATQARVMGT